jgi:hypothetical protein
VIDLLKVAQHGRGENVYLVRFHYLRPPSKLPAPRTSPRRRPPESGIAVRRNPRLRSR